MNERDMKNVISKCWHVACEVELGGFALPITGDTKNCVRFEIFRTLLTVELMQRRLPGDEWKNSEEDE